MRESLRYRFTSETYPLGMVCFGENDEDAKSKVREFLKLDETEEIHLVRVSEMDVPLFRIN